MRMCMPLWMKVRQKQKENTDNQRKKDGQIEKRERVSEREKQPAFFFLLQSGYCFPPLPIRYTSSEIIKPSNITLWTARKIQICRQPYSDMHTLFQTEVTQGNLVFWHFYFYSLDSACLFIFPVVTLTPSKRKRNEDGDRRSVLGTLAAYSAKNFVSC